MTKYLVHIFFIVVATLAVVVFVSRQKSTVLPTFIKTDEIAVKHESKIVLAEPTTRIVPSKEAQAQFKLDYNNIWAHLNHLYSTNNVEEGKEYYTEDFFKSICKNRAVLPVPRINREDKSHNIVLQSWSWDGLVCVGVDTSLIFKYTIQNKKSYYTKAKVAFALLFQGDHWRIDGIKFIEEKIHILK